MQLSFPLGVVVGLCVAACAAIVTRRLSPKQPPTSHEPKETPTPKIQTPTTSTPPQPDCRPPHPLSVDHTLFYSTVSAANRVSVLSTVLYSGKGQAWGLKCGQVLRLSARSSGDLSLCLNIWAAANSREHLDITRTRILHGTHVTKGARLWSGLPFLRPLATVVEDSITEPAHDLLGTACDSLTLSLVTGKCGTHSCYANLANAIRRLGLARSDVHDPVCIFRGCVLDSRGKLAFRPYRLKKGTLMKVGVFCLIDSFRRSLRFVRRDRPCRRLQLLCHGL
eukprot:c10558_g1_i3.p1 GENE.c10558_g1_i3~~c10558_g1_i3.p1  ORF type:complete len:280 (+),score=25.28 c10558_g1_i3:38-877(+)